MPPRRRIDIIPWCTVGHRHHTGVCSPRRWHGTSERWQQPGAGEGGRARLVAQFLVTLSNAKTELPRSRGGSLLATVKRHVGLQWWRRFSPTHCRQAPRCGRFARVWHARLSPLKNTSVRTVDVSPLFSWLSRFAAQVMNNMRIGKGGKNQRTEKNCGWRKPTDEEEMTDRHPVASGEDQSQHEDNGMKTSTFVEEVAKTSSSSTTHAFPECPCDRWDAKSVRVLLCRVTSCRL